MIRSYVLRLSCLAFGLTSVILLSACGGGSSSPPPPPPISVSLHPQATSLVAGTQSQQFTAAVTNDPQNRGVTWSVDSVAGGSASVGTISAAGLYLPPASAGTHTVKATSVADTSKSALASIGVTDLPGIFTYHYDAARDGVNSHEFALSPSSVTAAKFGLLFSCQVDGAVYAEPLWMPSLNVNGSVHNVVFVATQHDSLYAFDADAKPCQQLWHVSLIDANHGGTAGEASIFWQDVGNCFGDTQPEVGVTGTPVIDAATNTLYVVTKSEIQAAAPVCPASTSSGNSFFQRLHAINVANGSEMPNSPVNITASVPGIGDGSSGGNVPFDPQSLGQRPGLALLNNVVISGSHYKMVLISWASHEDAYPYHGWLIGYNAANVQQQLEVFNTTPDGGLGGIWMAGDAPAIDANNNIYFATGNGTFDVNTGGKDYGDSILKIGASGFSVADYFTADDQATLNLYDIDLGSGGVVLLPDQTTGPPHLLVQGGKEGLIYLIDRDNMGKYQVGVDNVVQEFQGDNGSWTTVAFWQNNLYIAGGAGNCDTLKSYDFIAGSGFTASPSSSSSHCFPFPGATPVVSSAGNSNGVVWAADVGCYGPPVPCSGGAVLQAYDATNLSNQLWSTTSTGAAVKFSVPTVANGKVYLGTRTELEVYGLLP
jgi:hypothetical protein